MLPNSLKIALYFISNSHKSFKIVLGLRNNDTFQFNWPACFSRYKGFETDNDKAKKITEFEGMVIRGLKQALKLKIKSELKLDASKLVSRSVLTKNDHEHKFASFPKNTLILNDMKNHTTYFTTQESQQLDNDNFSQNKTKVNILKRQELSKSSKESKVPSSQVARIASFGGLATNIGFNALIKITKQKLGLSEVNGKIDSNIILTKENAQKIVDTLCKNRGAALKIGQMLSLQDSYLFDNELASIFQRVRESADFMPFKQVTKVLSQELGKNWIKLIKDIDPKPFAAASIGQVHKVILLNGSEAAMKIQYPGVDESIDSDIKNLMLILKVFKILPKGLFIDNIIQTGRKELAWEIDYIREAKYAQKFAQLIQPYQKEEKLNVPKVINELSTQKLVTFELVNGISVDKLNQVEGITQEIKNNVARRILSLCLREIFIFKVMQTDPNWSNFLYEPENNVIHLLDFGASRTFSSQFVNKYMNVINAAAKQDREKILKTSQEMNFLSGYESKIMEEAHVDAVMILGKAFSFDGQFDFGSQNTIRKITNLIPIMLENRLTPPPKETYSLHRKTSGIFLLCSKLNAKINCKILFDQICQEYFQLKLLESTSQ